MEALGPLQSTSVKVATEVARGSGRGGAVESVGAGLDREDRAREAGLDLARKDEARPVETVRTDRDAQVGRRVDIKA